MKKSLTSIVVLWVVFISALCAFANPLQEKFKEATVAFQSGDYKKAEKLYEETIQMYDGLAPAYFYLALVKKQLGASLDEVTALFEKTVEVDPNHALAYDNLCKIYYSAGDFEKALTTGERAVELDPSSVSAKLSLGWVYLLGRSEPQKAIPLFEYSVDQIDIPYAYLGLGMAYFMNGERFKVLDMVTKLRKNDKEDLALQLENMLRQGENVLDQDVGQPLFTKTQPKAKSALVKDLPETSYSGYIDTQQVRNMPVRLSNPTPPPSNNYDSYNPQELSAQERIRQLQQRGRQTNYKGSGY